jgi:hypothetical protein
LPDVPVRLSGSAISLRSVMTAESTRHNVSTAVTLIVRDEH